MNNQSNQSVSIIEKKLSTFDKLNILTGFVLIFGQCFHLNIIIFLSGNLPLSILNKIMFSSKIFTHYFGYFIPIFLYFLYFAIVYFLLIKILDRLSIRYYGKWMFLIGNIIFFISHDNHLVLFLLQNNRDVFFRYSHILNKIGFISYLFLFIICSRILIGVKPFTNEKS